MKIKRTAKWMEKLTMKELKHLAETSGNGKITIKALKANRVLQGAPQGEEGCWDCMLIARKIGLEK